MIVSHEKQFIFVRNRLSATTVVEAALMPHLAQGDFLGPGQRRSADAHRFDTRAFGGFDMYLSPILLRGLSPVGDAYRLFCRRISPYKVFAVERNPWERLVQEFRATRIGRHLHDAPIERQRHAFRRFLARGLSESGALRLCPCLRGATPSQRTLYEFNDVSMIDTMLRHECLDQDLGALGKELGIDGLSLSPDCRELHGSADGFRDLYDDDCHMLVEKAFDWEINTLGYSFDGNLPEAYTPDPRRGPVKQGFLARVCR